MAVLQADQLGAAGAGVEQQHDERGIPAGLEALASQALSSRRSPSSGITGSGWSGTMGGFILAIGLGDVLFLLQPAGTGCAAPCSGWRGPDAKMTSVSAGHQWWGGGEGI
jgi:hypothetical protein